ncbi:MAG TPA: poly-gamma-glutamate hydrolase family protein [Leptolyngbyaceae cyanobacterium]
MATYNASVKMALLSSQTTLINRQERCSADPEKLTTIGRANGHQIRVKNTANNEYAIYTVSETRQENPDNIVRMGQTARERLGATNEFNAIVDSQVVHPSFTDIEAEEKSEFVERLTDNGTHTGLIAIAPHGGNIEPHTDEQAERVASQLAAKGVSSWRCKGWKQGGGAYARWHITSTDINPASFPLLNTIINRRFTHAVAFHGFSESTILIGGGANRPLKEEIQLAIKNVVNGSNIIVEIAGAESNYGGDSPANIVNRLTNNNNGIQIEQSETAREKYWQQIADAVASVYNSKI